MNLNVNSVEPDGCKHSRSGQSHGMAKSPFVAMVILINTSLDHSMHADT